jgi:hypothetical protein
MRNIRNGFAVLFLSLIGGQTSNLLAQTPGTFTATGNMTAARAWHTATLLPDGRVLIAGGVGFVVINGSYDFETFASAEIYDPSTGSFSVTGNMTTARSQHTATLLANGKVLIAGGDNAIPSSAELYDPTTGMFTAIGSMTDDGTPFLSATLLADGRVLFVAEYYNKAGAQVYDPSTSTFAPAGSPIAPSTGPNNATLLPDGKVLVVAWADELDGELYDPGTNAFVATEWPRQPWIQSPAALLLNGQVLLPGGVDPLDNKTVAAEVYDTATQFFAQVGNMTDIRTGDTATLLPDGRVLIAGGDDGPDVNVTTSSTELYDPETRAADGFDTVLRGMFSSAGNMVAPREEHTATLLNNGKVLIAGGLNVVLGLELSSAELYTPASLIPAPGLFSLSGDGAGQGAIWHSATGGIVSASDPAIPGEVLSMYAANLAPGGVVPPQVIVGGQLAQTLYFGAAPGYPGYFQINFRLPEGVVEGAAVPLRLSYLDRSSNVVSIGVQ